MAGAAPKKRLAILISGRGSNMQSLLQAVYDATPPLRIDMAEIALVISNRADAPGLAIAQNYQVKTIVHPGLGKTREAYDAELHDILLSHDIDLVCLAGFMRILSSGFVDNWAGRMMNIHPSLLPQYKGLDTHARALADGAKIHGCTVHFVTPGLDEGPIVLQADCPVLPGDTAESLGARVLSLEHDLYPKAVQLYCAGKLRLAQGRVEILDE